MDAQVLPTSPLQPDANQRVFRALTDPTRQRILQLLIGEELNVSELVEVLHQPQSTISRHLKVLRNASLIIDRRDGATSFYKTVANGAGSDDIAGVLMPWFQSRPLERVLKGRLERVLRQRTGGSGSFFERLGKRWDELRSAAFGDVFATEALVALLPRDWIVADIGTGTGYLLPTLADNFRKVIAVDPAPTMLECARQRVADHGASNVSFHLGDLSRLPIEDESVDLAIALLVLHHVPRPADALAEIHRVLRSNGRILLVEQRSHENQKFYETMQDHWWGFDPADISRQVREAGFNEVHEHGLSRHFQNARAIESPGLFVVTGSRD